MRYISCLTSRLTFSLFSALLKGKVNGSKYRRFREQIISVIMGFFEGPPAPKRMRGAPFLIPNFKFSFFD